VHISAISEISGKVLHLFSIREHPRESAVSLALQISGISEISGKVLVLIREHPRESAVKP